MDFNFIEYSVEENTAIIKFNRPDVLNSFNRAMGAEVRTALESARDDKNVRAILITANGKGFCAGQDLVEAVPPDGSTPPDLGDIVRENYNPIILLMRNIEKPVVTAVNGVAAGAGANIALAGDVIVASESASFIQSFTKIGVVPDSGGTYFLPRLVGMQRASFLTMMADKISAEEAYGMGMVYKVYPEETFYEEALSLAEHLSEQPTKALAMTKRMLNESYGNTLEEQLALEAEMQSKAGGTHDYSEGIKAFQEKRKPGFKGE